MIDGPTNGSGFGPGATPPGESAWAWVGDVVEWSQRLTDQSLVPSLTGHIVACVGVTAAADLHDHKLSDVDTLPSISNLDGPNRPYSYVRRYQPSADPFLWTTH